MRAAYDPPVTTRYIFSPIKDKNGCAGESERLIFHAIAIVPITFNNRDLRLKEPNEDMQPFGMIMSVKNILELISNFVH